MQSSPSYYQQSSVVVSTPQPAQPFPIPAGRRGSSHRSSNTGSTPFLPMSIPLPNSQKENFSVPGPLNAAPAVKLHAHQQSSSYNVAHGHSPSTATGHRRPKHSYAGSAYHSSTWDNVASTPPKEDIISSVLVGLGLGIHGLSQKGAPHYPHHSNHSYSHNQGHSHSHSHNHNHNYGHNRQYSGSGQGSFTGPLGFSALYLGNHGQQQQQQQANYSVGSPQAQPSYIDTSMRRVSGSYAEPSPLASVPLSLPISILKNSILKPRKRVTFADPLVTYFDAPVATSSTPTSVSHPPHMSIPKHSMHPSFVDQSSNNISNASLRNSTYSSNNLGLGHAASLNENDSLPLPEMQRTYEQDGNIGGSSSGGGGGSGRSHHKHRHSIHGYSNVIGSDISGSYDPHESKRHRRSQLYWDESSTFLLEKLKLTREHQRDNSHSHSHNNHSCHHRHRSSQRSRSSYNDGSPLSGDASAASATQYRYDERFALAMEHLPINNNQPSS